MKVLISYVDLEGASYQVAKSKELQSQELY
jgi:hypothetical protein